MDRIREIIKDCITKERLDGEEENQMKGDILLTFKSIDY